MRGVESLGIVTGVMFWRAVAGFLFTAGAQQEQTRTEGNSEYRLG